MDKDSLEQKTLEVQRNIAFLYESGVYDSKEYVLKSTRACGLKKGPNESIYIFVEDAANNFQNKETERQRRLELLKSEYSKTGRASLKKLIDSHSSSSEARGDFSIIFSRAQEFLDESLSQLKYLKASEKKKNYIKGGIYAIQATLKNAYQSNSREKILKALSAFTYASKQILYSFDLRNAKRIANAVIAELKKLIKQLTRLVKEANVTFFKIGASPLIPTNLALARRIPTAKPNSPAHL